MVGRPGLPHGASPPPNAILMIRCVSRRRHIEHGHGAHRRRRFQPHEGVLHPRLRCAPNGIPRGEWQPELDDGMQAQQVDRRRANRLSRGFTWMLNRVRVDRESMDLEIRSTAVLLRQHVSVKGPAPRRRCEISMRRSLGHRKPTRTADAGLRGLRARRCSRRVHDESIRGPRPVGAEVRVTRPFGRVSRTHRRPACESRRLSPLRRPG